MKNIKLFLSVIVIAFIFSACAGDAEPGTVPPPEVTPPVLPGEVLEPTDVGIVGPPERDLGGLEIRIVNWTREGCTETADPESAAMRARWDDRADMEERYNFRIRYYRYGSWGDVRDGVQPEILAGSRAYTIWELEPSWFVTHHGQRLFAPIPMQYFEDDYGIDWNPSVLELTMRDGSPHGWAAGEELAGGVFFNQRLFEEAGLEYDLPFTLQREGNWTWDTFLEAARRLSRDIDGDGIIDTWALTAFNNDFLNRLMASNNAAFATIDPVTGEFVNASNTPQFLEAIEFAVQMRTEMLAFHEMDIGGYWNSFIQMFDEGHGAMRSAENYVSGNLLLTDPWGFVSFPRGPSAVGNVTYDWIMRHINVIPHFFSEEEISDIMFAVQRWIRPIPGEDPDDWLFANLVLHPDTRSVEETIRYFTRPPQYQLMPTHQMMPGLGHTIGNTFAWRVWSGNEPSVIVEEAQLVWGDFIQRVNAM